MALPLVGVVKALLSERLSLLSREKLAVVYVILLSIAIVIEGTHEVIRDLIDVPPVITAGP